MKTEPLLGQTILLAQDGAPGLVTGKTFFGVLAYFCPVGQAEFGPDHYRTLRWKSQFVPWQKIKSVAGENL